MLGATFIIEWTKQELKERARPQNKKMLLQKAHTVCCTFSLTFLSSIARGRDPATMGRE